MSADTVVFDAIKRRRVTRAFADAPIERAALEQLLWAARWAPSAGNRRIQKFVVIDDKETIAWVRSMAPGMLARPAALIVICTDAHKAREEGVNVALDTTTWIDVGAAAQNIMLTAQELGLGTCPTTSFSRSGVRTMLNLPAHLEPEYIVQIGKPEPQTRTLRTGAITRLTLEELSFWGAFPAADGEER